MRRGILDGILLECVDEEVNVIQALCVVTIVVPGVATVRGRLSWEDRLRVELTGRRTKVELSWRWLRVLMFKGKGWWLASLSSRLLQHLADFEFLATTPVQFKGLLPGQ